MSSVAGVAGLSGVPERLTRWSLIYIGQALVHEEIEPIFGAVPDEDADRAARFAAHVLLQAARCLASGQVSAWPLTILTHNNRCALPVTVLLVSSLVGAVCQACAAAGNAVPGRAGRGRRLSSCNQLGKQCAPSCLTWLFLLLGYLPTSARDRSTLKQSIIEQENLSS